MGRRLLSINPCPKCGNELRLIVEAEYRGRQSNVSYGYACSVCRHRERIERINIELNGDKLIVSRVKYIK